MKNVRSCDDNASVNIQHIFINGQVSSGCEFFPAASMTSENVYLQPNFFPQIWYEVTCDIAEDTELLLGPKVPLLISDMRREVDDRSGSGL